jgi:hypothetical protein
MSSVTVGALKTVMAMVVAIVMFIQYGKPLISCGTIDYQISVKLVKNLMQKNRDEDYTVIIDIDRYRIVLLYTVYLRVVSTPL